MLEEDVDVLDAPPEPIGVRLLPAKDAFMQARDRSILLPDLAARKAVFPTLGGPGVVLHKALPIATWRGTAKSKRYEVKVVPFGVLTKAVLAEIETEVDRVAHARSYEVGAVVEPEVRG